MFSSALHCSLSISSDKALSKKQITHVWTLQSQWRYWWEAESNEQGLNYDKDKWRY